MDSFFNQNKISPKIDAKRKEVMISMRISKIVMIMVFLFMVSVGNTVQAQPEYAKWGRLAMQSTTAKYPNAMITDYQHLGRTELNASTLQESFKLQLREGNDTYYVIVKISFNKETEKVNNITFEKRTE
jgi:hypothetical protein